MCLRHSHKRTSALHGPRELKKTFAFFCLLKFLPYCSTGTECWGSSIQPCLETEPEWQAKHWHSTISPWPRPSERPLLIHSSTWPPRPILSVCLRDSSPWVLGIISHRAASIPGSACQAESHHTHCFQYVKCWLRTHHYGELPEG